MNAQSFPVNIDYPMTQSELPNIGINDNTQPLPEDSYEPLSPEEMKNGLMNIGRKYLTEGFLPAMNSIDDDPRLSDSLAKNYNIITDIANNPNPKNDTPEGIAVNGITRALTKTIDVATSARKQGLDPQKLNQNPTLWEQLKKNFTDAQAKPGTALYNANEIYWNTLSRGGGYQKAAEAYVQTYTNQVNKEQELLKSIALETTKRNIQRYDQIKSVESFTRSVVQGLANTNIDTDKINEYATMAQQAMMIAKDNPNAASATATQIMNSMVQNNMPEKAITTMAKALNSVIKIDNNIEKQAAVYQSLNMNPRELALYRFGIYDDERVQKELQRMEKLIEQKDRQKKEDETKIQRESDIAKARQMAPINIAQNLVQFEKQTPLEMDRLRQQQDVKLPYQITTEQVKQATDTLMRVNEELQRYGLPLKTMEQINPQVAQILKQNRLPQQGAQQGVAQPPQQNVQPPQQVMRAPPQQGMTIQEAKNISEGQKQITTEAGKVLSQLPDLKSSVKSIDTALDLLDSGKHNIGSTLSVVAGRGRIAQAIGSQFETEDSKNTAKILDVVNKFAAEGLKLLGSNPSTVDLEFWTKYKPNETSNPELVKEWLTEAKNRIVERVNSAEKVLNPRPAQNQQQSTKEGTTSSGNKFKRIE